MAASPSSGVNTLTGLGLAEALKGAPVVADVANSPSFEDAAVLNFFETSTRNLLRAEADAGVGHHVVLSFVGALALVATAAPVNGIVELAGPEAINMDELVRRHLSTTGDTHLVVADARARYYGTELDDQTLTPGNNPRLGSIRFEQWLSQFKRTGA